MTTRENTTSIYSFSMSKIVVSMCCWLIYYFVGIVFGNFGTNEFVNAAYISVAENFLLLSITLLSIAGFYSVGYVIAVKVKCNRESILKFIFWSDITIHISTVVAMYYAVRILFP
jgi:hypothetical protein